MRFLIIFLILALNLHAQKKVSQYVNPFIGTGGHGHTFPGATVPFGMVQLSPDTRIDGSWDGCSGYHYSDSIIYGFSHTHLSGTGCSDFGDIMLMPMKGNGSIEKEKYSSQFSHKKEKAKAGYYQVELNNGIKAELTSTTRVGVHQYTFPKKESANIILDLTHRDETVSSYVKITSDKTIEGSRSSKAWATMQHIYYAIEFSEPMEWEIFLNEKSQKDVKLIDNYYGGKNVKAIFNFKQLSKPLLVKVGISNVSAEGAKKNLQAEATLWDFDTYKKNAAALWEKELNKIQVTSTDTNKLSVFYTALYHCMIHPSIANDVDGNYRGRDQKIHKTEGHDYYSVFSLWDTYRALHPLFTIIDKKRTEDFIKTFILQYEQGGRLPVWELASNETECMIGYHSVSVISDAYVKGIKGFDIEKAFTAMKASAMQDHFGLSAYKKNNVITIDDESESVSRTLEYAYDDWCIAQVAQKLKKDDDYNTFIKRSQSWKNVFDPQSRFMRARKNGDWQNPFDPREVNNNFTEANSWQYSFYVPHDIEGLISAYASKSLFEKQLDKLFTTSSKTTGRTQSDITGLIGQYAHGNEPSHHMAYLYNYTGSYNKTVKYVDSICTHFYKNDPDGLIGNEDCGQMSAWYVLSSLGIYQVCPGSTDFIFGKPQFTETTLTTYNNTKFKITKNKEYNFNNASGTTFTLNAAPYNKLYIDHADILKGGSLNFVAPTLTIIPDSLKTNFVSPKSKVEGNHLTPMPIIHAGSRIFNDSLRIVLINTSKKAELYYRTDSTQKFKKYEKPFTINTSSCVEAYSIIKENKSGIAKGFFTKRPNSWKVKITNKYNKQYSADGDIGIIDGLRGDTNWKKGNWQGYQSTDFEAIVDMNEIKEISFVGAGFLQDTRAWIIFPTQLEVLVSVDGVTFEEAGVFENKIAANNYDVQLTELSGKVNAKNKKVRYIKFVAKNFGKLPEWHAGKGDDAFIFVDELIIK